MVPRYGRAFAAAPASWSDPERRRRRSPATGITSVTAIITRSSSTARPSCARVSATSLRPHVPRVARLGDDQAVKWLPGASPTMVGSHEFSEAGKSALASPQASRIPLIGPFRATLGHIHFADQSPALMREYVEKPRGAARVRPSSSGHNLSSVLWQLCQEAKSHREIVDWRSSARRRLLTSSLKKPTAAM